LRASARPGWKTRHTRLRFWVISHFNNYPIYYERREDVVSIQSLLEGRRDVRRIIAEGIEHLSVEDWSFRGRRVPTIEELYSSIRFRRLKRRLWYCGQNAIERP